MDSPRLARVRALLATHASDALLLSAPADVHWLSGFRGSNGTLIVTANESVVVTDFRYRSQVVEQAPGWTVVEQQPGAPRAATFAGALADLSARTVTAQADHLTQAAWQALAEALQAAGGTLQPASGLLQPLRELKDESELAAIRRAARVADQVMEKGYELARPGLTERQLKAELEYTLLSLGAEGPSFDMILAGGEHSALPHAPITDRPLAAGDLLTMDLGAIVDGYCSDLTRTVAIVSCDAPRLALYELVYEAQLAALAALRPGVSGREVDEVARGIIRAAGHGDHFGHGLGHGVGLEIHEGPRLASSGEAPLQPGHIVTVEPGVYVPGLGGVRIEDLVVVTESGCELLSQVAKPARPLLVGG